MGQRAKSSLDAAWFLIERSVALVKSFGLAFLIFQRRLRSTISQGYYENLP